jgi:hypothetical protein
VKGAHLLENKMSFLMINATFHANVRKHILFRKKYVDETVKSDLLKTDTGGSFFQQIFFPIKIDPEKLNNDPPIRETLTLVKKKNEDFIIGNIHKLQLQEIAG